jgi:hypothetical protein
VHDSGLDTGFLAEGGFLGPKKKFGVKFELEVSKTIRHWLACVTAG